MQGKNRSCFNQRGAAIQFELTGLLLFNLILFNLVAHNVSDLQLRKFTTIQLYTKRITERQEKHNENVRIPDFTYCEYYRIQIIMYPSVQSVDLKSNP